MPKQPQIRFRSRTEWWENRQPRQYIYRTNPASDSTEPYLRTLVQPPRFYRFKSLMRDYECQSNIQVSNPCSQLKIRNFVPGHIGPPDGSQVNLGENAVRYMSAITGEFPSDDYQQMWIPTELVAGYACNLFPQLRAEAAPFTQYMHKTHNWPTWAREGWKEPKLTLTSDFNLVNFLLELRQSLQLTASWVGKKGLNKRFHAIMGHNKTLPDRAKALANERLAHVYGTKLMIADARQLFNLITGWRQKTDSFLAQCGMVKLKQKVPVTSYTATATPWVDMGFQGIHDSKFCLYTSVSTECHATLYYQIRVPEIRGFLARLGQMMDAFGVKPDLGIAWDAVQFTFVADWFLNIGEWLHANASRDWTKLELQLCDFATSGKMVIDHQAYWSRTAMHQGVPFQQKEDLVLNHTIKYYDRRQELPPPFRHVDLKLHGDPWRVNRVINSVALAIQKSHVPPEQTPLWFNYRNASRRKARQFRTKFRLM